MLTGIISNEEKSTRYDAIESMIRRNYPECNTLRLIAALVERDLKVGETVERLAKERDAVRVDVRDKDSPLGVVMKTIPLAEYNDLQVAKVMRDTAQAEVNRLRSECDLLRVERNAARVDRGAAEAEVKRLQTTIRNAHAWADAEQEKAQAEQEKAQAEQEKAQAEQEKAQAEITKLRRERDCLKFDHGLAYGRAVAIAFPDENTRRFAEMDDEIERLKATVESKDRMYKDWISECNSIRDKLGAGVAESTLHAADRARCDLMEARGKCNALFAEGENAQAEIAKLKTRAELAEGVIAANRLEVLQQPTRYRGLSDDITQLQRELREAQGECISYRLARDQVMDALGVGDGESVADVARKLRADLASKDAQLSTNHDRLCGLLKELDEAREKIATLKRRVDDLSSTQSCAILVPKHEHEKMQTELNDLRRSLKSAHDDIRSNQVLLGDIRGAVSPDMTMSLLDAVKNIRSDRDNLRINLKASRDAGSSNQRLLEQVRTVLEQVRTAAGLNGFEPLMDGVEALRQHRDKLEAQWMAAEDHAKALKGELDETRESKKLLGQVSFQNGRLQSEVADIQQRLKLMTAERDLYLAERNSQRARAGDLMEVFRAATEAAGLEGRHGLLVPWIKTFRRELDDLRAEQRERGAPKAKQGKTCFFSRWCGRRPAPASTSNDAKYGYDGNQI